uniref:Uncharacterized protein n=1 Tax=Megaselia scalaris TaxID=36166 RepID=T1GEI8_MEGSC
MLSSRNQSHQKHWAQSSPLKIMTSRRSNFCLHYWSKLFLLVALALFFSHARRFTDILCHIASSALSLLINAVLSTMKETDYEQSSNILDTKGIVSIFGYLSTRKVKSGTSFTSL